MEELERSLIKRGNSGFAEEVDEYYSKLGLEDFGLENLNDFLRENNVVDESDLTFVIPRQVTARTLEQESMRMLSERIGCRLEEEDIVSGYSVRNIPVVDKMYSRNPEKRGYVYPLILTGGGMAQVEVTSPRDGFTISSHDVNLDEEDSRLVRKYLGGYDDSGLREFHESIADAEQGGFLTGVQRDIISELFSEDIYPDLGLELDCEGCTGKAVLMNYNPEEGAYMGAEGENERTLDEMGEEAVLTGLDSYRYLVFPYMLSSSVVHVLNGLESDFRPEESENLRREINRVEGVKYPVINIGSMEERLEAELSGISETKFGSPYEEGRTDVLLNTYPSDGILNQVDAVDVGRETEFGAKTLEITDRIYNQVI